MQDLADRVAEDQIRLASIEDTIRRVFGFEDSLLWDSPGDVRRINAAQDGYTSQYRDPWANVPPHSQYGETIPTEMQVEGEPTVYWKGLPKTFTTCDYNSDELSTLFHEKFCMGLLAHALARTMTLWDTDPAWVIFWVVRADERRART